MATATRLRSVPSMLRERLNVVEVPGYLPEENAVIAVEHLLPGAIRLTGWQLIKSRTPTRRFGR